jgi:hypothetical protein
MAEAEEAGSSEGAETTVSGAGLGAALALGRRKAKTNGDPQLDAFLAEHTRLARLQSEHLNEQRDLTLSRLRWAGSATG